VEKYTHIHIFTEKDIYTRMYIYLCIKIPNGRNTPTNYTALCPIYVVILRKCRPGANPQQVRKRKKIPMSSASASCEYRSIIHNLQLPAREFFLEFEFLFLSNATIRTGPRPVIIASYTFY